MKTESLGREKLKERKQQKLDKNARSELIDRKTGGELVINFLPFLNLQYRHAI